MIYLKDLKTISIVLVELAEQAIKEEQLVSSANMVPIIFQLLKNY